MRCVSPRVHRSAIARRPGGSRRASQINRTRRAPTVRAVVVANSRVSFAQARNRLCHAMVRRPPNRDRTECPSKIVITDSIESISAALNGGVAESVVRQRVRIGTWAHGGCACLTGMSARLSDVVTDPERSVSQPSISTCGPAASRSATAIPPAVLSPDRKLSCCYPTHFSRMNNRRDKEWISDARASAKRPNSLAPIQRE